MRAVDSSDCVRLMGGVTCCSGPSRRACVFLIITWPRFDLAPSVVARWMESRRASVPGWPNTVPDALISRANDAYKLGDLDCWPSGSVDSATDRSCNALFHTSSSLAEHAETMISCRR